MAYKVPFVDLPQHFQKLEQELWPVLKDVLFTRADLMLRRDLVEFEENVSQLIGTKYAVGLNSGTDALFLSLKAAGIGTGDEVITVSHTFFATVEAIVMTGATPILIDINDDFLMNHHLIEKVITNRTRAIIPVHLNGRVCEMDKIIAVANRYDLLVIEDACQAWGGSFDGKKAGSIGLTGCFSLYPFKVLGGIGDGGIITTNDKKTADQVRLYRDHCQNRETRELFSFGYNSRLDNLNAAVLNIKMKHLDSWIERRRQLASIYQEGLSKLSQIKLPPHPSSDRRHSDIFQNYVIRAEKRDPLVEYLTQKGIETLVLWPVPIHRQKALKLDHFDLPITDRISNEVVSLPMNSEISDSQVSYVIQMIHRFFEQ